MKKEENKTNQGNKKSLRPFLSRLPIALAALSVCAVLILWDTGVLNLPFLKRVERREPLKNQTETMGEMESEENETSLESENIDYLLYAKNTMESLFDFSFLSDEEKQLPQGDYDPETQSLVKTRLPNKDYRYFAGFLLAPDGTIYRNSDLYPLPDSRSYALTVYRDENGSVLFYHRENGDYYTFDHATLSFLSASYDPVIQTKGIDIPMPSSYGAGETDRRRTYSNGLFGYEGSYSVGRRKVTFTVENQYPTAFSYSEGYAVMADEKGKVTIRNEKGEAILTELSLVLPEKTGFDALGFHYFDHGLLRVQIEKFDENSNLTEIKETVIDGAGQEFTFPKGYYATSYYNGIFTVTNGTLFGHYSAEGKWITPPSYTEARPFFEGVAVVKNREGKVGLVGLNGKEILPCTFDSIEDFCDGATLVNSCSTGPFLLNRVTGTFMPNQTPKPPQISEYTKITITRGPENTYQEEEELETLEFPEIVSTTTQVRIPDFWE